MSPKHIAGSVVQCSQMGTCVHLCNLEEQLRQQCTRPYQVDAQKLWCKDMNMKMENDIAASQIALTEFETIVLPKEEQRQAKKTVNDLFCGQNSH